MKRKLSEITRLGAEYLAKYGISEPLIESEYIISSVLNIARTDLYLKGDEFIEDGTLAVLRQMIIERATTGKPSAYIVGKKEFYGLEFQVNEDCLIPRPETEILVDEVIKITTRLERNFAGSEKNIKILDIGCGSGNIAVTLAKFIEKSSVWAVDISYGAVLKTLENALLNQVYPKIAVYRGDLFAPFSASGGEKYKNFFDIIVSNPPYVSEEEFASLPREVSLFEPRIALSGGADGLDFYRRIIPSAKFFLSPKGGMLFLEMGAGQKEKIEAILIAEGYKDIFVKNDYNGIERIIAATFYS